MRNVTLLLALGLVVATTAHAQTTKPQNKATKGTLQLAGDNGKLNTTYTLGKVNSINITVTDVRFSVTREIVGKDIVAPNVEEKLLVIDFTAHNPNPDEIQFNGSQLKFTAVDQESVNRDHKTYFTRAKTGEVFNVELKPAQKVELRTVIVVPAAGTIPKLMLEHKSGGSVLRIDLRPYLKPVDSVFGDPKDTTGMSTLSVINGLLDTYYPMGGIDVKSLSLPIEKHGNKFSAGVTGGDRIYASVKFSIKGQSPKPAFLRFQSELVDENGDKYPVIRWASASSEAHSNRLVELDEEYVLRFVAVIPKNAVIKFMRVTNVAGRKPSRTLVFPVSS